MIYNFLTPELLWRCVNHAERFEFEDGREPNLLAVVRVTYNFSIKRLSHFLNYRKIYDTEWLESVLLMKIQT